MGCLKMRVLESASTLVSTENASTEYASTENVFTKVLDQDNASTENTGTDERHGKFHVEGGRLHHRSGGSPVRV